MPFNNLGSYLRRPPQSQLALNPITQSVLAQQLLSQSMQSPQGLVSPSGVANKALQGLLAARAAKAQQGMADQTADRQQGLAGALTRANQPVVQGDPASAARAEAAKRAASIIAGGLPNDPLAKSVLAAQASNVFGQQSGEGFTLSPGQTRYNAAGQTVVQAPGKPDEGGENALPKLVNDISDDLYKESSDFTIQLSSLGRIRQSAQQPSAAGDMALIFGYMKMLDPGSTVREGEYATAENARGVPATIRNMFNKIANGERLEEGQRSDFLNRAERLFAQEAATQGQRNERFLKRATSLGVPESMFRPLLLPLSPAAVAAAPTQAAPSVPPPIQVPPGPAARVIP